MMRSRRNFLLAGMGAMLARPSVAGIRDEVVLITNDPDPDFSLEHLELRKLFLGFLVVHDHHILQPVRNRSDDRLDQVFMQHVMAMSADTYERRLLALTLRQGRPRPMEVHSHDELVQAFLTKPHCVSFAWRSRLKGMTGVHTIMTLWWP